LGLWGLETGYVAKVSEDFATFIFRVWVKSGEDSQVKYSCFIFTLFTSPRMDEIFFSKTSTTKTSSTPYKHLKRGLTLGDKPNK
jgi:hypothetical protein